MAEIKKSGIITICGRPNVGKSTLTNALVGEKVAIVTNKPQTTRNRICGVRTRGESQFVFVDTPGLHKARTRLGDYMVNVVKESVADVDAVMLLVEPIPNVGGPEEQLIARIKTLRCPAVLVINKVDTLDKKEKLLEVIQTYEQAHQFQAVVPISAKTGEGVDELLDVLEGYLPEGPQLFPEDMTSDQPERQMMAEILREKLLLCLDKEIPPRHRRGDHPLCRAGRRGSRGGGHHLLREEQPQGHHHRQGRQYAEKGVHPGPAGHGALYGHQGLSPDLGEGEGELAGQPGGHPELRL